MASRSKTVQPEETAIEKVSPSESYKIAPKDLNCEVHTLLYRPHNGFANYTIATIKIEEGIVTDIQYSDPYNGAEALWRMDVLNGRLLEKLRRNYPTGFQHG